MSTTVGIVGAGVSGLATHHYLRERGVNSVVFESTPEPEARFGANASRDGCSTSARSARDARPR